MDGVTLCNLLSKERAGSSPLAHVRSRHSHRPSGLAVTGKIIRPEVLLLRIRQDPHGQPNQTHSGPSYALSYGRSKWSFACSQKREAIGRYSGVQECRVKDAKGEF